MPFSMLDNRIQERFIEYKISFNEAEHLARALSSSDVDEVLCCLDRGLRHTRRAMYDAYDANANFYLEQCKFFEYEYKHTVIPEINSNYLDEKLALEKIKKEIASENRQVKEVYIEKKKAQLQLLKDIYTKWDASRPELNKKRRKDFIVTLIGVITVAIALIGLIIA